MTSQRLNLAATITSVAVAALVLIATAAPVSAGGPKPGDPTTIVVQLHDRAALDDLQADYDLVVVEYLVPGRGLFVVAPDGEPMKEGDLKKLAKVLTKDPRVAWAEVEFESVEVEDDRFHAWPRGRPHSTDDDADDWASQDTLDYLDLARVHSRSTGNGVIVAVLDTGIDMDHPYLAGHLASDGHYDYLDDDTDPTEETDGVDDDGDGEIDEAFGHGTHAAGLIALVAPEAEIRGYRVLDADGGGDPYVVALAVNDAIDDGADVINLSFGRGFKPKSKYLKEAFKRAKKENVTIVAAAGNGGRKDDSHFPAREKDVIGVAASMRDNSAIAQFSNFGKPSLVAAPGEGIVSTLPGGGFGAWSGTSMAAPIVSGQAALVRSGDPELDAKKVIEIVGKSARKLPGDRKIEKGLIDILRSLERLK